MKDELRITITMIKESNMYNGMLVFLITYSIVRDTLKNKRERPGVK